MLADTRVKKGSVAARALVGCAVLLLALAPLGPERERAAEAKEGASKGRFELGCRLQPPQRFLERRRFLKHGMLDGKKQTRAIRYLVERYGNAGDEETTAINPESASLHAKTVSFFGMPVSVHARIAPALTCVEKYLKKR